MADAKTTSEFKDLFDLAKSKKYVTYDEINELMPAQVVGAAQIDELLMKMMAEYNVELVASEKKIPIGEKKSRKLDEDKPEEDEEELAGSGGRSEAMIL
jgi:RNA polymerase primary sigma factor